MKNIKMLLLPVALMSIFLYGEQDRKDRVERIAKGFHFGADVCDKFSNVNSLLGPEFEEDSEESTISENLSALDYTVNGKDPISRAKLKQSNACPDYVKDLELMKKMLIAMKSVPEAEGLTLVQIRQKTKMDSEFREKMNNAGKEIR